MLYNKSKSRKLNDKKVLHKVRKRWIVVSSALLMALGGAAAATRIPSVHADVNNPNAVKSNLDSNQERVSQLTDKRGNSLNDQGSNLRSGSLNSAEVTSQARQLHSQILQNKVMSNADLGTQKSASSSVSLQNSESSSFNNQVSNNDKLAKATVNNNNSKVHSLGSAKQAYGTISIEDVDIHDGNKEVNNGFGSITKPAGTPFTKSDQDSFTKVTPPGYIFNNVISAPTHFIADQNQEFKIAVVPRKFKQATSSKILLEYTDADNGDIIVGKVHEFSDVPGTPFHLFQWEANRPDGYVLDPNDNNSNTISYQSSDKGNPTDIRHFIPNNNPNIEQPSIKYVPGTQLVQIGVKRDSKNSTHSNSPSSVMAHMTVQYMDSVNHTVKKTLPVSGSQGSAFNVNEYANPAYLPSGYNTPLIEPGAPSTYANNEVATILVTPDNVPNNTNHSNSDDHKKADQTMAMMPVVYYVRNNNNYQVIGSTLMAKGYAGSTFNVLPYITTDVPTNYSWVGFRGNVPSTYNNNDSVGIVVAPKASNNQHSQQQVVMPVEYQYQGQTVPGGKEFATGTINSRFDITPFENNVPENYRFAGTNNQEPQYYKPNSIAIINVVPNNVANNVIMPISYVYNKQTVGTAQAKGRSGQSFDITPYEQNVTAKGYHFDPQNDGVNAPNVYIAGYRVIINVSPNANSEPNHKNSDAGMAQMPINYVYNNQRVGTSTAYGVIGQPLNPQQYEQTVPNGYKYVNGVVNAPQTYMNDKSIIINVVPINSNNHANSNSQQTTSYITVQWINGQNGKVSDSLTLPGNPGQSFPLTYYENSAPEGTHSTGQLIGYPVTKFTTSNQTVKIQVLPNQAPVNQYGTITVRCVDPNGNTVGHSDTTNHKAGTPFDLLSELQFDIPSNYHFVKFLNGEGIHQYNAAQQNVKIEVALNNINPTPSSSNNNDNQETSSTSVKPASNQTSSASTSQPINNNFNPVINNNVPNSNVPNSGVASNSSNSDAHVPNTNSQMSDNSSNSGTDTRSNVTNDSVIHHDAKGTNVNSNHDSDPLTNHDRNSSDVSALQKSNHSSRNNNYGYRNTLNAGNVVNGYPGYNQPTASVNDNGLDGIDSSVSSTSNRSRANSVNNGSSRLPQTNENSEDRKLAEIGSVLTAISIGLSQLGYSMEKHRRHDN